MCLCPTKNIKHLQLKKIHLLLVSGVEVSFFLYFYESILKILNKTLTLLYNEIKTNPLRSSLDDKYINNILCVYALKNYIEKSFFFYKIDVVLCASKISWGNWKIIGKLENFHCLFNVIVLYFKDFNLYKYIKDNIFKSFKKVSFLP